MSKKHLMSTAAYCNQNVSEMKKAEHDGASNVGSVLLEGVRWLCTRVANNPKDGADDYKSVGNTYALSIINAERKANGEKVFATVDEVSNKFALHGMVKAMRVAAERDWWSKYLANVEKMHREKPVKITTLINFARHIFGGLINGKQRKPVTTCPDIDTLKTWRKEDDKRGAGGSRKRKPVTPAERISTANEAMGGYETWLPKAAHAHAERVISELKSIAELLPSEKASKKSEKPEANEIDALKAQLAALVAKLA